jgi:DeoR family transcriptional regulator of aga operon
VLTYERRRLVLDLLKKEGKVEVNKLAQQLNVSPMTIRRDLDVLSEKGLALRTRGGAISPNINYELPLEEKMVSRADVKKRIGERAATLIEENESVLLDAGTTCLALARCIQNMHLTVITSDIRIAFELYKSPTIKLIVLGGIVQENVGAITGSFAEEMIDSLTVDKAFIGTSAVDNGLFLSTPTLEKASLKRKFIMNANSSILLADSSKFGRSSLFKICHLEQLDLLITDDQLDSFFLEEMESAGVNYDLVEG